MPASSGFHAAPWPPGHPRGDGLIDRRHAPPPGVLAFAPQSRGSLARGSVPYSRRPAGRRSLQLEVSVPVHALPPRRARRAQHDPRDVRDRLHWDNLATHAPRHRHGSCQRSGPGAVRTRLRHLPVHPHLPRRVRPVRRHLRTRPMGQHWPNGTRSRQPCPTPSRPAAPPSRTTTPSGATTDPGTTGKRPEVFATALTATKSALDPAGKLNPGALLGELPRWASTVRTLQRLQVREVRLIAAFRRGLRSVQGPRAAHLNRVAVRRGPQAQSCDPRRRDVQRPGGPRSRSLRRPVDRTAAP